MIDDKLNILIIENSGETQAVVPHILTTVGLKANISVVHQWEKAHSILTKNTFDCVFLDEQASQDSALKLVKQFRAAGNNYPLIVLLQDGDEQTAVELMKAGASDCLKKAKLSPENISRSLSNAVRIHRAEQEAEQANQRLRESEERYRFILEGSYDGIWDWDFNQQEIYGNDRLLEIVGLFPLTKITPKLFCSLIHPEDYSPVFQAVQRHLNLQTELEVQFRLRHSNGEYRYCVARGKAQRDRYGKPFRMSGILSDITEQKYREQRDSFLVEASSLLGSCFDYKSTLNNLAQLAVIYFADWCVFNIIEDDNSSCRIAFAHADSQQEKLVAQLETLPLVTNDLPEFPVDKMLYTGSIDLDSNFSEQSILGEMVANEPQLNLLKKLKIRSYICVPLQIGTRSFGSMLFVKSSPASYYSKADLELAEDLAQRTALAIENAKLYDSVQFANHNYRKAIQILGEQEQQLRTLQQLTNLLNQRLTNLSDLLNVMATTVCDAIAGAETCFITLFNSECDRLILTIASGKGTDHLKLEDIAAENWLRQVFLTGKSQLIQGITTENPNLPAAIYAVAIESVKAGRLGVLAVGNWEDPNAFNWEDKYLLTAVGEQAAIAIDNARLIKTLEEREQRLEEQNQIFAQQNTELANQRRKIQLQNLQLIESARIKTQFLATISHHLRTPLNAIIGFSQLLLRGKNEASSQQQIQMLERILANSKELLEIIDNILDLCKIQGEQLELQLQELNLVQLVATIIEDVREIAEQKNLVLAFNSSLENVCVINDSFRVRQIILSLLSNAIKFTEQGSIEVGLKEVSENRIELMVKDTGIGIAEEEKSHIFEEFGKVDQALNSKYYGTGLGLAITDSLVQLMQGKITVESQLGKGSTFRVELPRNLGELGSEVKVKNLAKIQARKQNNPENNSLLLKLANMKQNRKLY
ncbi:MAG: ATP-binding protein [Oscillatoria sp. PMC 1068.18]|nr:ATP-binding protein [Oscillatoria sp. PMC 1076.18]MEC4989491.1 ATP-binding protein [Oscillatoria sp. PMC 1068.18]